MNTLFGTIEPAEIRLIEAERQKKNGWLPMLTVLFLISYALMTMLIVEQGQTIDSQRVLIRELFRDSKQLSDIRLKQEQQTAQAGHPAMRQKIAPQLPSTQARRKAPSSQAGSQFATRDRAARQKSFQAPSRPGTEVADSARSLMTI